MTPLPSGDRIQQNMWLRPLRLLNYHIIADQSVVHGIRIYHCNAGHEHLPHHWSVFPASAMTAWHGTQNRFLPCEDARTTVQIRTSRNNLSCKQINPSTGLGPQGNRPMKYLQEPFSGQLGGACSFLRNRFTGIVTDLSRPFIEDEVAIGNQGLLAAGTNF